MSFIGETKAFIQRNGFGAVLVHLRSLSNMLATVLKKGSGHYYGI